MASKNNRRKLGNDTAKDSVLLKLPKISKLTVTIIGETAYVGSNYSEDTRKKIRRKQEGETKTEALAPRNVEKESQGRRHIVNGVDCIPASAIRSAMKDVAKEKSFLEISGEKVLRGINRVMGDQDEDFITILNEKGKKHSDPFTYSSVVKVGKGQRHIAYRPKYKNWSATFDIVYLENILSGKDVLSILAMAGITTGIGDNRRVGGGRFHPAGKNQNL